MSVEFSSTQKSYEQMILTVNEHGEEIEIPVSQIPELQTKEDYSWGDAMVVEFDKGEIDE